MDNNIFNLPPAKAILEAFGETTSAIVKFKEIQRTTGITKLQKNKLLREDETYAEIQDRFAKTCDKNPGLFLFQKVGNSIMCNIDQVMKYAKDSLDESEKVPSVALDSDWLIRFLDVAGYTSNEEKQRILARVLIGKIKKPSDISYRTLGVLKDLSLNEIKLFRKSLGYAFQSFGNYILIPRHNDGTVVGLSTSETMLLDECGLFDDSVTKVLIIPKTLGLLSIDKKYLLLLNVTTQQRVNCNYFTQSALELIPYLGGIDVDESNIMSSAKCMCTKNCKPTLHRVNDIRSLEVDYKLENLIKC